MENGILESAVLVRGGGDLGSGVALRLHRCGMRVMISELPQPVAVRRRVCFSEAVYQGTTMVEDCIARRVSDCGDTLLARHILDEGRIPILIDPEGEAIRHFQPDVVVDARMLKQYVSRLPYAMNLLIGLGPGFVAGDNCDAVVETNRGISLGRVIWKGSAEPNTSVPKAVGEHREERVLRAPADGPVTVCAEIGDHLEPGQLIAEIGGQPVKAPFKGVLRGLINPAVIARQNMKIGDIDPRDDARACIQVSEKSLAIAGGVLEAILAKAVARRQ